MLTRVVGYKSNLLTHSDNIADNYVSVGRPTLMAFVLLCLGVYLLLFITRFVMNEVIQIITANKRIDL